MYISAWMYALAGLCFLFGGGLIVSSVNTLSLRFFPTLPVYPLPGPAPEGKFWLVLSLSMMAMITYISRAAYLDLRRNGRLVPILLLSKFCSSMFYLIFFATSGQLVHLVGLLTDGPLFLITFALWIPASPGDEYIDGAEADTLAAIGEALFPRGGAFEAGYADFREECIADARKMFAGQYPSTRMGTRMMIRIFDLSPLFMMAKPVSFRRLPLEKRQALLNRIEHHRYYLFRMMFFGIKLFATVPFFNRDEAARAVGFNPEEAV